MRRVDALALMLFAACAALAQAAFALPVEVPKRAAPRRIVSLDLCTDWLLLDYAPRTQVAALSPMRERWHTDDLGPHDWPTHDGSLERILMLKPDLVITGQYNAIVLRERMKELGVRVEVLPLPTRLDEVDAYEKRFLELIGQPASRASAALPASDAHHGQRLLMLGDNGIGMGAGTLEDDVLRRAGWTNYLQSEGRVSLDMEKLVTDKPDAVLWSSPSSPALANRFAEQPVLKRAIPASRWLKTDTWRWQCPGPWTWDLVRQLRDGVSQ